MKARSYSTIGSMHPALFFVLVYVVALFFSIFICSAIFYELKGPRRADAGTLELQTGFADARAELLVAGPVR